MKPRALKDMNVGLAVLFGSRATGRAVHPKSDVDIGIVFISKPKKDAVRVYDELYSYFRKKYPKRKLDIVYLHETPYKLQFRAMTEGKVLYAVSKSFMADWREAVMNNYFDFSYIDKICSDAFLKEAA